MNSPEDFDGVVGRPIKAVPVFKGDVTEFEGNATDCHGALAYQYLY
jgi:hypothetical protein